MVKGLVLALLLTGCASLPPEEYVWQAMHAIDTAQTVQIARNPDCYHESNPITSRMIGKHPSTGEALAWGVGMAGLHAGVTSWMHEHDTPTWLQWTWQILSIVNVGVAIENNNSIGLGLTSSNNC